MKKLMAIMIMLMVSILSLGAVESKLVKDENGRFSGEASLGLVASGRIVERPKNDILVIQAENNDASLEITHKNVKNGNVQVAKQKFMAIILEKDENGNLVDSKEKRTISSRIVSENGNKVVVKNLQGEEIGEVSYGLVGSKKAGNTYEGEVTSKLVASKDNSGNFIDKSIVEIMIQDTI